MECKANNEIYRKYLQGTPIYKLTKEYFLSEKSIRRIISTENKCAHN